MSDEKMLSVAVGKGRTHGTSETSNKNIRKEKILKNLKQNEKILKTEMLGALRLIKEKE